MTHTDITIGVLAVISLVGVIVLAVFKLDTQVLIPITTALIGALIGKNTSGLIARASGIVGSIKKK